MHSVATLIILVLTLVLPQLGDAAVCAGASGYPTAPFVDANCDDCYDSADGDDADVSQAELEQQPFLILGCFVVPKGAHVAAARIDWVAQGGSITVLGAINALSSHDGDGVFLRADEKITIAGSLRTDLVGVRTDETPQVPISLRAAHRIELAPKTKLTANGGLGLRVDVGGEIVVGAKAQMTATKGSVALSAETRDVFGPWAPPAGRIQIGAGTRVKSRNGVAIRASRGLDIGAGVSMTGKQSGDPPSILLRAGYAIAMLDTDLGGDLTIGPKLVVKAPNAIAFEANGALQLSPGATLNAANHNVSFAATGNVEATGLKVKTFGFYASSSGGNLSLGGSLAAKPAGAPASIAAPTGTCAVSGLEGLARSVVAYDCASIAP